MPLEQICVPGVSSRRFACDRCRGQKLRCLREHADQQCCDRCLRADAECRTSPIFRMRSYVADDAAASNNNGGGERAQKRPRLRQYSAQTQLHGVASQPPRERDAAVAVENPPALLANTTPTNIFDISLPSSTIPEHSGDFSLVNTAGDMQWEAENPIFYYLILSEGMDKTFDLFDNIGNSPENSRPQISSLIQDPISRVRCSSESSLQMPSSISTSGLQSVNHRDGDSWAADLDSNFVGKNPENQVTSSSTVETEPEKTYVQRLSNINLNLVTLLARIDKESPTVIIETLVTPIDESISSRTPLDDMLNSTREFLDVLNLLAGPSQRPSVNPLSSTDPSPMSNSKSKASRTSLRNQPSGYATSLSERDDSIASSPTESLPSSTSIPPSASNAQPNLKLDFASLLLILTSYIYQLRLYVVLFAHVHEFLKELSASDNPYLCPLPGLSFSNFPLRKLQSSARDGLISIPVKC